MRMILVAAVLSCVLLSGCTDDPIMTEWPEGQVVVHKLSKRQGQVIGYGFGDNVRVRFTGRTSMTNENGVTVSQEAFEDVNMRPFEMEVVVSTNENSR